MAKQGYRIMDSDMHVMEPHDLWSRYLEPRFRDRAPRLARSEATGQVAWQCEGRFFPAFTDHPKRAPLNRARYDQRLPNFTRYEDARRRGYDVGSQLDAMDREGIDVAVVFRTIGSHVIAIDEMDPELSAALCRAFNRWLAERCAEAPERLKATAVVPIQDVALSVREARHAVEELGHVALVLPSNPIAHRAWYDEAYFPLWETACDLGVPLAFHSIQGAYQEHLGNRFLDNLTLMHAVAHPLELMMAMGGLITGGVFERFPGLRAAFLEGTCAWVPWWLWRLDDDWEKLGRADRAQLKHLPSETFRRHCFVAVEPGEELVGDVVRRIGDDNLVISTDWPHDDSAYPHAMDTFLGLEGIGDASRRKILWDNCARLYGLDA